MLLAAQVEGQSVDVNNPLFVVVHRAVHPDAGGVETPAGVKVVQGVFVFGAPVGADGQGRSVAQVKLLFVAAGVVVFVVFGSLFVGGGAVFSGYGFLS